MRTESQAAFTLLELLTVFVVVAILVTMLLPAFEHLKGRAELVTCRGNLSGLYAAGSAYIQDYGHWPQVSSASLRSSPQRYADEWISHFAPYQIGRVNWICPTAQRLAGGPDFTSPGNHRIDYLATPFDDHWGTPYRWPTQPWFVEKGSVHGRGNLLIYSSGKVEALHDVQRGSGASP